MKKSIKNEKLDSFIAVRMDADLKEKLKKEAKRRGLKISTLARMWIMEYLEKYPD